MKNPTPFFEWKPAEAEVVIKLREERRRNLEALKLAKAKRAEAQSQSETISVATETPLSEDLHRQAMVYRAKLMIFPGRLQCLRNALDDCDRRLGIAADALVAKIEEILRGILQSRLEKFQRANRVFFGNATSFLGSDPFLKVWAGSTAFTEIELLLQHLSAAAPRKGATPAERADIALRTLRKIPSA